MARTRTIELDTEIADALEERANARGVPISEVVSQLVALDPTTDDIAKLDAQWAAIEAGEPTIPHDEVARWLKTWGTPAFKPWAEH